MQSFLIKIKLFLIAINSDHVFTVIIRKKNKINVFFNILKIQSNIEKFFNYETTSSFSKQSKRMKNAITSFKRKNTSKAAEINSEGSSKVQNNDLDLSETEDEPIVPIKQKKTIGRSSIQITKKKTKKKK